MKTLSWLSPLLALSLLAGCAQAPIAASFSPPGGGFSVQMPGAVEEQTGDNGTHMFLSGEDNNAYIVAYTDLNKSSEANAEELLDGARNGLLADGKRKLISEQKITVEGHPGRELRTITKSGFHTRFKLIVKGKRLYQVGVVIPKDKTPQPDTTPFFNSFHFTGN